ncbi:hypothetical protein LQL77_29860 [Rhodococcus cerastii]|nr:hypothetical protein [Rhodococcus cerastii]
MMSGDENWGENDNVYTIIIKNENTNDDAKLIRPVFGNTGAFWRDHGGFTYGDTKNEVMSPNSEAILSGIRIGHRPDNMDFEFMMRERRVHAWIRSTPDGKVKATCDSDSTGQAMCFFGGVDKDGFVQNIKKHLELHISYDEKGPQPQ